MAEINPTTTVGARRNAAAELRNAKADAALVALDGHINGLLVDPTNAEVVAAVIYNLRVSKKMIQYLMHLDNE